MKYLPGTPFSIGATPEGLVLLFGRYALTPPMTDEEQIQKHLAENEWNIMVNVMHAMLDFHKLLKPQNIHEDMIDAPEFPLIETEENNNNNKKQNSSL